MYTYVNTYMCRLMCIKYMRMKLSMSRSTWIYRCKCLSNAFIDIYNNTYIYTNTYVCKYIQYAYINSYIYVSLCLCVCVCQMFTAYNRIYMCLHIHTYTHVCTNKHAQLYIYVYVYSYLRVFYWLNYSFNIFYFDFLLFFSSPFFICFFLFCALIFFFYFHMTLFLQFGSERCVYNVKLWEREKTEVGKERQKFQMNLQKTVFKEGKQQ